MHQASEHTTTAARHRLPARPPRSGRRLHSHPVQHQQWVTRSHVGERKRIAFTTLGSTLTLTPNPSLLPRATQRGQRHPAAHGAGHGCPAPYSYTPHANGGKRRTAHTPTVPTPEREHASKQAGAKGRRDNDCPTTPRRAHTPKHANTKRRTRAVAQTPNPSHPRANTPTTSLSKYAPKRTQGTCPHQHVWAHQV